MTEQDIRAACESYKHPVWGVVGLYPANGEDKDTFTCDNYHLFNALYWRILDSWGYTPNMQEISKTVAFTIACEKDCGLYARFPTRMDDDISQDEIYGICFNKPAEASYVNDYGEKNFWCYNLAAPGKCASKWRAFKVNYFYARFMCFVGYVKACANEHPLFSQVTWSLGALASAFAGYKNVTGKLQTWLMIPEMKKYFISRLAIITWCVIMKWRYKNGVKELMSIYFGEQHPFALCAKNSL